MSMSRALARSARIQGCVCRLSNIPETYGNIRLEGIYTTAPLGLSVPFAAAGSGIGGRLILCINYLEDLSDEGRSFARDVIRMRNRMLQYLGFPEKESDEAV